MQIREATTEDATEIKNKLLVPAFREDEQLDIEFNELDEQGLEEAGCEFWLEDEERVMFIAETDEELIAQISAVRVESPPIYTRGDRAHIDGLYVKEKHRRKGVATSLIERIEEWAKDRDCESVGVTVHKNNVEARDLYERDFNHKFLSYRRKAE
ncbi:GNAT family N-acetyltransferase [Halocatena marina]|uniref:GNAT family N-acetyltransferase n=1 Tax=Halocatena marina TaxID=2934937 RepID=A0ABD5YYZ4_9EURY|nr:GNAT family N-acetyltransferase [Halocatena marina]